MYRAPGTEDAEFAVVLSDAVQGQGLGTEMLRRLIDVAKQEKVRRLTAEVHSENAAMLRVCEKLGFHIERDVGEPTAWVELKLS